MSLPSTKDVQESAEKLEKLLQFIAHSWRTRNWVRVLSLCAVVVALLLNPWLAAIAAPLLNLPMWVWYTPAWVAVLGALLVGALVAALRAERPAGPTPVVERRAIKGLRPFALDDAEIFKRLQREEILRECVQAITAEDFRLGLISGESGSGKTSFLQAGLWPGLEARAHRCALVKFTNQDPLLSIRRSLDEGSPAAAGGEAPTLAALLEAHGREGGGPLVVIFDQFEQFFIHRKRRERRAFVEALAEWYRRGDPRVKLVACVRSDFSDRLIELQKAMGYSLGPQESFRLEKFEPEQAVKVFGVMAETEGLAFDEGFVEEFTTRELAGREDGLVSPVDVQILAWMIIGQQSQDERAFNRAAYQKLGGVEGLLEKFLRRALGARETEARRQTAIKVLLALTDLEQNARAGAMPLEEIRKKTDDADDVGEAVEWLARGDVRLLTPLAQPGETLYELAHERLIPALRRLAGRELTEADVARQMLNRRAGEWVSNDYDRRYLLSWRELSRVRKYRSALTAETRKDTVRALLRRSRRRMLLCAGAAFALAAVLLASAAWWYSPWGQLWQAHSALKTLDARVNNPEVSDHVGEASILLGGCERVPRVPLHILAAVAAPCAEMGKKAEVLAALDRVTPESPDYVLHFAGFSSDNQNPLRRVAHIYTSLNERARAVDFLHKLEAAVPPSPLFRSRSQMWLWLAEAFAAIGEDGEAYRVLRLRLQLESESFWTSLSADDLITAVKTYEQIRPEFKDALPLEMIANALRARESLAEGGDEAVYAALCAAYATDGNEAKTLEFARRALPGATQARPGSLDKGSLPKEYLFDKGFLAQNKDARVAIERYGTVLPHSGITRFLLWSRGEASDSEFRSGAKTRSQIFSPLALAFLKLAEHEGSPEYMEHALASAVWLDDKDLVMFLVAAARVYVARGDDSRCRLMLLSILYDGWSLDADEWLALIRRLSGLPLRILAQVASFNASLESPTKPDRNDLLTALIFNAHVASGNRQKAFDLLDRNRSPSLKTIYLGTDFSATVGALVSIADNCVELGEPMKTDQYLAAAEQWLEANGAPEKAKTMTVIAEIYARAGDWRSAYRSATATGKDVDSAIALAKVLKVWAARQRGVRPPAQAAGNESSHRRAFGVLAVGALEFAHELGEGVAAGGGEGVVDGGADAADGAVAFEAVEAGGRRLGRELLFEVFGGEAEGDVHDGAGFPCGVAAVEVGGVNHVVNLLRLLDVLPVHPFEAPLLFHPLAHQVEDVDAPGVRRVVERAVLGVRAVVEHRRQSLPPLCQKVFADDDDGDARGAEVLLRARVDERVLRHVNGPRADV